MSASNILVGRLSSIALTHKPVEVDAISVISYQKTSRYFSHCIKVSQIIRLFLSLLFSACETKERKEEKSKMGTSGMLLSNSLSSIDAKPLRAYTSVNVTEADDALTFEIRPQSTAMMVKEASVTVTEFDDTLPFDFRQQSLTSAVKESSGAHSTAFEFTTEVEHYRLSFDILNILEKYGRHLSPEALSSNTIVGTGSEPPAWIGKDKFLSHVYHHVRQMQPVQLMLPAFPCKSV